MLSEKATLFNIVHGSFVDGWGIRTTVFLKGCPLRCRWCCNPESQEKHPQLQFIAEHCDGCGKCLNVCPHQAITLRGDKIAIDRTKCDGCGKCVSACWQGALEIWGRERTAEDVFAECLRDAAFYKESGGGVTLSGGEATLWPDFCLEILERCHGADIPVAIDTCGYMTGPKAVEVLKQADLVLFDVKGLDPFRHRENTGVDNGNILHTLSLLEQWNKPVIIRYPVIPNHNLEEAQEIASFLSSLTCVRRVDLIPYHPFGSGKYEQLGRSYPLTESTISEADQTALLNLFLELGLPAQLGG